MRKLLLGSLLLISGMVSSQTAQPFSVELKEITIKGSPGVQAFTVGELHGKWLIIGGRTDGLHQRQPHSSFLPLDNNVTVYVVDPVTDTTYSAALSAVPTSIYEQLQSTNMEFEQRDSTLYIIGGYGYSATKNDHTTYPNLTAVDISGVMNAVINQNSIVPYFRQITDTNIQVTGGYLDYHDGWFYLAGGQFFEGRYNPQGPTHGPGFTQRYTDAIKKFKIQDNGTAMSITNFSETKDNANLHRRDYNMVPQIFATGDTGFTMFSGVFQHTANLPWLNTVDVRPSGYTVVPSFNQYLNQYHTANLPIRDGTNNAMHTLFFGGISRYTLTSSNQLVDDQNVPFVKTLSKVTRYSNSSMMEYKIGELPALLGSGAEFIKLDQPNYFDHLNILQLDSLPQAKTLVGHVIGGIESSAPNIFFSNTGTQSDATTRIFEVYIHRGAISSNEMAIGGEHFFDVKVYPNPTEGPFKVELSTPHSGDISIQLMDLNGKLVDTIYEGSFSGNRTYNLKRKLAKGVYLLKVSNEQWSHTEKVVVSN